MKISRRLYRRILCAHMLILLGACQGMAQRTAEHSSAADEILKVLDESLQTPVLPAAGALGKTTAPREVSEALLPQVPMEIGRPDAVPEQRFDLAVEDAPVQVFYMSLVKGTPYNMVVHPSLQGKVSLNLKNVTVSQTMDVMRRVYGYEYRHSAMGFEVLPREMQSRIFHINYLNVQRKGVSEIRVSSGQISESSTTSKGDNKAEQTHSSNTVSGSEVNTLSQSDFWQELDTALKALITEESGRKVVVNPQSGVVIVRAMPDELHDVEDYLIKTQAIIKRQVILEAKILEVELNDGFQTGINWAAFMGHNDKSATIGQVGGGTIFNGSGQSEIAGNAGVLDPLALSQVQGTNTSAFGGVFSLALNLGDFNAFIEALETQGDVHVLSSPRVSTVNNQKAVIKVGSDEFFVTDITTQLMDTTTGSQQSVNVQLTPFFSGVALDVIPQINEDNVVTLHVHPSVSDVTEKIKQIDISTTDTLNVPLALSTIRESDSIVSARSGQVIVIGGLMQNVVNDTRAGVPWLSDLPLIGGLFRHKQNTSKKSELVILLKPVVVENGDTWSRQIRQSRDNMRSITRRYGNHGASAAEGAAAVGLNQAVE